MQPMGDRLGTRSTSSCGSSSRPSPWKVEPVRRQIAEKAVEAIGPEALGWLMIPASPRTVRPRRGWPGSTPGHSGKVGDVQIGVSVHAVTDHAGPARSSAAVLT